MPAHRSSLLACFYSATLAWNQTAVDTASRLVILPELRHSILMEAPDVVADLILDFLAPAATAA